MRILITGDSWSQGEWDGLNVDYRVTHRGIEQYLVDDGHDVVNVGQGGYNNLQALDSIKGHEFDHLIFFFTDPLRQATFEDFSTTSPKLIAQQHTDYVVNELEKYPQVTLIGGACRVTADTIKYVIPSMSEVIVPGFTDTEYMTSHEWEDHWKRITNPSQQFKQEIVDIADQAGPKYKLWEKRKDYFWPDGYHANRKGIRIVYDHMLNLWSTS